MDSDDIKWREEPKTPEEPKNSAEPEAPEEPKNPSMSNISSEPNANVLADITIKNHRAKTKKTKKNHLELGLIIGFVIVLIIMIVTLVAINITRSGIDTESSDVSIKEYEDLADGDQITSAEISAGSATVIVGGKSVTYRAAYLIDGRDVTIYAGKYESTVSGEAVFLVINGGKLRIEAGTEITKTFSNDSSPASATDDGTSSAIVVIGENSSAEIIGANISTATFNSNAIVAANGAQISVSSSTINTEKDESRGLYTISNGIIHADDVAITTKGANSYALASSSGPITATNMGLETTSSSLIYSADSVVINDSIGTSGSDQIIIADQAEFVTQNNCEFTTK